MPFFYTFHTFLPTNLLWSLPPGKRPKKILRPEAGVAAVRHAAASDGPQPASLPNVREERHGPAPRFFLLAEQAFTTAAAAAAAV